MNGYGQADVRRERSGWRMTMARRVTMFALAVCCLIGGSPARANAAQQPPPAARDEFVPVKELPPGDELPAAPFLIAAYAVAWVVIAGYAWSLWRQLGRVERELQTLNSRLSARGR